MKKILCFVFLLTLLTMPAGASKYYYTRQGDSMVKIALQNRVPLSALREYNPAYTTGKLQEGSLVYVPISKVQARAMEREVVRLVNQERESRGLAPVRRTASISRVARQKADDMCTHNYFSHTSPTYGTPFEMLEQNRVRFSYAGENIAFGQVTAEEVVQAWMNSKGHRENILNPAYTKIGVGCADNVQGSYWVQIFVG
ncbi:MAG: CAP domain-containing protein [Acutalibacteraceae bacterium]